MKLGDQRAFGISRHLCCFDNDLSAARISAGSDAVGDTE
jgi:hypothetical protein